MALKLVLSRMVSKGRTRQFASHDVSVAFFHAWLEQGVWVKPPKELRLGDNWLWYVVKALYGMRESSKAFQDVVRNMYLEYEWTLLQTVPCLAYSSKLDTLSGWHGDDFYTEGESEALDEIDEMILRTFKAKVLPRLGPGANVESTILRRTLKWSTEGVHLTPDAKHVENLAGSPRGQGCEAESDTLFPSHWSWTTRCVGTVGCCGGNRVPKRYGNRIVPRPGQIRLAVCDKGACTSRASFR